MAVGLSPDSPQLEHQLAEQVRGDVVFRLFNGQKRERGQGDVKVFLYAVFILPKLTFEFYEAF